MDRRFVTVVLWVTLALAGAGIAASRAAGDGGGASPGVDILSAGVLAPSGKTRYVAIPDGSRTVIANIVVRDGSVLRYLPLRGQYGMPFVADDGSIGGISFDGRVLVLAEYAGPQRGRSSSFAVVDTRRWRLRRIVTLRGDFAFDALSPNGRMLYLVEHVSSKDYSRYRVRAYDVPYGRLLGRAIVDRRTPDERMAGYPVTRATSPDGTWAYTLYQRPNGSAFIHALNTSRAKAVCVDLPRKETKSWIYRSFMRVSHDGTKLVLGVHGTKRLAAVVDTRTFRVTLSGRA